MSDRMPYLTVRDAKICYKNFSGKAGKFSPEGRRSFCLILDSEEARKLQDDGWNVRIREPRDAGEDEFCTLQVFVRFDNVPPRIYLISNGKKTELDENSINVLDYADIQKIDMTITPYHWEAAGKTGIKAYIKTMYVTIVVDELAAEYDEYESSYNDHPRDDDLPFDI